MIPTKILHGINSVTLRLPQLIRLRSGVKVATYGKAHNNLFWNIFTSPQYIQHFRALIQLDIRPSHIIDCGAAWGYFSLLIKHMVKNGLLDWKDLDFTLVEPNSKNVGHPKINAELNFQPDEFRKIQGLVGKHSGSAQFFRSRGHPWGSSVHHRENSSNIGAIPFFDLTDLFDKGNCLLKLDIEGGEFDFFCQYRQQLACTCAIIVEFYAEMGNVSESQTHLREAGFELALTSMHVGNRSVHLYVKSDRKRAPKLPD